MDINKDDLIAAYGKMVEDRFDLGFEADLLTFMFNPLPGGTRAKQALMEEEIGATYYKVLTRMIRNPKNKPTLAKPFWVGGPDWPVPKQDKDNYRDVAVNDGLHYHMIALTPPDTRLMGTLGEYITENQRLYTGPHRYLFQIHAEPITDGADYVTGYALKSVKRGRAGLDQVLILPGAQAEQPSRTRHERRVAKAQGKARRRAPMPGAHPLSATARRAISREGLE
jgi:hypothetical protein